MPANVPVWQGTTLLVETPDSGELSQADRTTLKKIYQGPYSLCWYSALPRGAYGTGSMLGWVVNNSLISSMKGRRGQLTIIWEPGGALAVMPLPSDEFKIDPVELYPKIERNRIFQGGDGLAPISMDTLNLAYTSFHAATAALRSQAYNRIIANYDNPDPAINWQGSLGLVLADKLRKGEETFYLAGHRYTWTAFCYTVPRMSIGGYIEFPFGPGSIPANLPANSSWLRLADSLESVGVNGSMFKITRTWLGGPLGYWDTDIYSY